jgi:hypothetical protein
MSRPGHWGQYLELHTELGCLLGQATETIGEVARQVVRASCDFDRTEGQIEGDLRRLVKEVPDITPRQWVPYGYDSPGALWPPDAARRCVRFPPASRPRVLCDGCAHPAHRHQRSTT